MGRRSRSGKPRDFIPVRSSNIKNLLQEKGIVQKGDPGENGKLGVLFPPFRSYFSPRQADRLAHGTETPVKSVDAGETSSTPSLLGEGSERIPMADEPLIAVFVDFENLALGVRDVKRGDFQVELVLKRLLEKGRIVYKRAYCDWSNYRNAVREFHVQGIELIDIPQSKMSGKNSADIRMVVDALDLCYAKQHIDVFALLSGDSDFSPLVSKLKENEKRVIGCGVRSSTSELLVANCDEFIYYDDLAQVAQKKVKPKKTKGKVLQADKRQEGIDIFLEIVRSLADEYDPLWGSLVKQTMRRVHPGFKENHYGYKSFAELAKEAQKREFVRLDYDEGRGNYKIHLKE